ncbi:MAG: hypothetical protein IID41_12195 [Planctomycetes bacterium]|nr:hypothetical protein [Planctomycetota bacterium]
MTARFDGTTIDQRDFPRLGTQHRKVFDAMLSGDWLTLAELERETGYPQASISAGLRYFREARFGGYIVECRLCNPAALGTFEYRLTQQPAKGQGLLFDTGQRMVGF